MTKKRPDQRGIILAFFCGMVPLPLMLLWGAGWVWALAISLPAAGVLAWLRHTRPGLFVADGYELSAEVSATKDGAPVDVGSMTSRGG